MKLRLALVSAAALLVSALGAPSAQAVLNGEPTGPGQYGNVGMVLNDFQYTDGTWILCSGSLISPTVFLTAAHCGWDGEQATITFDSTYDGSTGTTYTGTFHADPQWQRAHSDPHDIAVIVFDEPFDGITPVQLPAAGSLSKLKAGTPVVGVGYGASTKTVTVGGNTYTYDDVRKAATGTSTAVTTSWLKIDENAARGNGGGCFGDSGGPNFIGDVQVSMTLSGDRNCQAVNATYRLDTPSARDFLRPYIGDLLP